jgi:SNF2 family DNA or RNA helicase
MRLRQICCDPALLFPGAAVPSAKLEALDDLIEPIVAEGHKVLIFSQFTSMLATLKSRLAPHKVPLFSLTGETERRGELVEKFNRTKGPAIFLISLKAGGSGLNLTSASYVILFDPWWNPAAEAQAIDRAHRIGQTRTVIAYRLLIKNSLEEKIRILQASKAALADGVLGEEALTRALDISQLRSLLEG